MSDRIVDKKEWALHPEISPSEEEPLSEYQDVVVSKSEDSTHRTEDCQSVVEDDDDDSSSTTGFSTISHISTGQQKDIEQQQTPPRLGVVADTDNPSPAKSLSQKIEDVVDSIRDLSRDMRLRYVNVAEALVQPEKLRDIAEEQRMRNEEDDATDMGPLHIAAQRNNTRILKALLENGADINARGSLASTALHLAAWEGNFDAVKTLALRSHVDLDARDKYGCTALTNAIRAGSFPCALLLVSKGADVDTVVVAGRTALHYACVQKNMEDLVTQLLAKSENVNLQDEDGNTPLHVALNTENWDYVMPLIAAGADLNLQNKYGGTPIHSACVAAPTKLLLDLVRREDVDLTKRCASGETVLHILCNRGLSQIAEIVLRKGEANIDAKTNWGHTPLMVAVLNNQLNTVRMLIRQDADVYARDNDLDTALTLAIQEGYDDIAEYLIDSGSAVDPLNQSPAQYRARLGRKLQAEGVYKALASTD